MNKPLRSTYEYECRCYYRGTVVDVGTGSLAKVRELLPAGGKWYLSKEFSEYRVNAHGGRLRYQIRKRGSL